MATTTGAHAPPLIALKRAALIVVAGLALYFVFDQAQYVVWNEES